MHNPDTRAFLAQTSAGTRSLRLELRFGGDRTPLLVSHITETSASASGATGNMERKGFDHTAPSMDKVNSPFGEVELGVAGGKSSSLMGGAAGTLPLPLAFPRLDQMDKNRLKRNGFRWEGNCQLY